MKTAAMSSSGCRNSNPLWLLSAGNYKPGWQVVSAKPKTPSYRLGLPVSRTQGGETPGSRWHLKRHNATSALPSMATRCMRDIPVPHPSGGRAVQIGYPTDLSGNPCRNDEVPSYRQGLPVSITQGSETPGSRWHLKRHNATGALPSMASGFRQSLPDDGLT